MRGYKLIERVNALMIRVMGPHGEQLWHLCKLRKPIVCCVTGRELEAGDHAWRPVTSKRNRGDRMTVDALFKVYDTT